MPQLNAPIVTDWTQLEGLPVVASRKTLSDDVAALERQIHLMQRRINQLVKENRALRALIAGDDDQ